MSAHFICFMKKQTIELRMRDIQKNIYQNNSMIKLEKNKQNSLKWYYKLQNSF